MRSRRFTVTTKARTDANGAVAAQPGSGERHAGHRQRQMETVALGRRGRVAGIGHGAGAARAQRKSAR